MARMRMKKRRTETSIVIYAFVIRRHQLCVKTSWLWQGKCRWLIRNGNLVVLLKRWGHPYHVSCSAVIFWWSPGLQNVRNPASAACRQGPNFVGRKGSRERSKRKKREKKEKKEKKGKRKRKGKKEKKKEKKKKEKRNKMRRKRDKKILFSFPMVKAWNFLRTNLKIFHNLKSLNKTNTFKPNSNIIWHNLIHTSAAKCP